MGIELAEPQGTRFGKAERDLSESIGGASRVLDLEELGVILGIPTSISKISYWNVTGGSPPGTRIGRA